MLLAVRVQDAIAEAADTPEDLLRGLRPGERLPLLSAPEHAESAYFGIRVETSGQVLSAMTEQVFCPYL